jgi:glycosyltransferase involved in cell wall biosynthesis
MITIVVATHNREKNLINALFSIVNQQNLPPCQYEILVVDDASKDNTKDVVEFYKNKYTNFTFTYIYVDRYPKEFTNPASSHNIGLVYAKGDLVIQSGADIVMDCDTIQKLYNAYIHEPAYYATKLCRLNERDVAGIPRHNIHDFYSYIQTNRYDENLAYNDSNKANATPFCCIYEKKWAYQIGLYDEEYAFGGGEDCDFVYRMQQVVNTRWLPTTKVTHQNHPKYNGLSRNEKQYKSNLKRLKNSKHGIANRESKRILFMASFNYLNTKGFLPDSIKQHFMRLGHQCYFYDPAPMCHNTQQQLAINYQQFWDNANDLQDVIDTFKPEYIFAFIPMAYKLLQHVDCNGAKKIGWYGDMRHPTYLENYRYLFDMLFLTNEGQAEEYSKILHCPVHPVRFAVSDSGHVNMNLTGEYDVGFAGQHPSKVVHTKRSKLLDSIHENYKLYIVRHDIFGTELFYNKCKIVIDDRCDMSIDENIAGYSSNRLFNIIGTGVFCLTRYFPGLEKWGKNKEHFVWFNDDAECLELIDYYLKHPDEREQIAKQGQQFFKCNHNWMELAKHLSQIMQGKESKLFVI